MPEQNLEYVGACLCDRVRLRVSGAPVRVAFCHCAPCRRWHAAPVNAWAAWPAPAVEVVRGLEELEKHAHGHSLRHWCRRCGTGLMNRLGDWTVVYAMALEASGYVHRASCHIHCDEAVFDMRDGLPKYVDLPAEIGEEGVSLLRAVKHALDPDDLLNPGNLLPPKE